MCRNEELAQLLFPEVSGTPLSLEERFPQRQLKDGARVTRFAPSPTGFLHIGGLFAAMIARLNASTTDGVFMLRIEDTDKKREITDGVSEIVCGLESFGITVDEGVVGFNAEKGDYGPYTQSCRKEIYSVVAKELVAQNLAYPCFCTEEELTAVRDEQQAQGSDTIGYFGKWARCRNLSFEEQQRRVLDGEKWTLRLRSPGDEGHRITFDDMIKGKIEMPENVQDVVLLKTDGIPTYHFAHAVDDHFMRTTHVIRGDEWISSVPLHIQLFKVCGYRVPKYAHISPIMKAEGDGKRKLSKRKDPEAAVTYYAEQGYPKESVIEYLLTLANSTFEDWRRANPKAKQSEFPFNMKKMSVSGALFDLTKLNDVSKNVISVMTADEVFDLSCAWAEKYDTQLYSLFIRDDEYAKKILSIDRYNPKPRKDIARWNELKDYISYFYDELYTRSFELPDSVSKCDAAAICEKYLDVFDAADDKDTWFGKLKELCEPLGFTPNVKEYKKNPEAFKGHIGDVSTVIRTAITGRHNTPDLHAIIALLGQAKTAERLSDAINFFRTA